MSLTLNLELSDEDLKHFDRAFEKAREAGSGKSNAEIVQAATDLLSKAQASKPPAFVTQRLERLDDLIAMLKDEGWALAEEDAQRVRSALVYFAVPADAIPDHVPVLGYLDDAIVIELCARELRHELEAYEDFCDYRQREADRRGLKPETVGRADWLEGRREELQDRMRRRRRQAGGYDSLSFGSSYSGSSYGGSTRYADSGWRPGLFKFR